MLRTIEAIGVGHDRGETSGLLVTARHEVAACVLYVEGHPRLGPSLGVEDLAIHAAAL
jgi:hypothetical protein